LESRWEIPKYPLSANRRGGRIAQRLLAKTWHFHPFSLKRSVSVYIYQKSQELWKNVKTLSGSSPIFDLSNHTTFSQTETGATVTLSNI
jgi:hypothetical protein